MRCAPGSCAHNRHVDSLAQSGTPSPDPLGVRLGVDPGTVRVGIARSDAGGVLAFPVVSARRGEDDIAALRDLIDEFHVTVIYVGLPLSLNGSDTSSTAAARDYANDLVVHFPQIEVRCVDERLTTVSAAASLRAVGKDARAQRDGIDAAAAAVLLQHVLESERSRGARIGELARPPIGPTDD